MASNNIKGLTIELGADTTKLGKALEDVEKKSRSLSGELGHINKLLKMDPGNADLLAQKQKVLAEAVETTSKRLDTLSKGNQQKIQLITALAHDPDIVILDEPFSGLDPVNAMLLKDVVKEQIAKGKIVLFSSHQMSYIEEFCDSIAILNAGKVALCGDLHDIKRNYPRDRLVVRTEKPEPILAELGDACSLTDKGEIIIKLGSADEKQKMMAQLAQKFDFDEIRVLEPSLNDIFVEYAGAQV